jgi:hypothetical protein
MLHEGPRLNVRQVVALRDTSEKHGHLPSQISPGNIYIGLAILVHIHTVHGRIFGDFPAKYPANTPYIYGSGQPYILHIAWKCHKHINLTLDKFELTSRAMATSALFQQQQHCNMCQFEPVKTFLSLHHPCT